MLPMAVLLISSLAPAHEPSQGDQNAGAEPTLSAPAPDLADVIPLEMELSDRLAVLETSFADLMDVSHVESQFPGIESNLKVHANQLKRLKDSKGYKYNKLVDLMEVIEKENKLFMKTTKPIHQAIRDLWTWRKEWLAEKKRWNEWEFFLLKGGAFDQLKSTFERANDTIETALKIVIPQLEAMLTVQEKAGNIQEKIDALTAVLDGLIMDEHRGALLKESPPMFSPQYFSQFSNELWLAAQNSLYEISWPGRGFFAQQGWIVLLQGFLPLFVIIVVYRNRRGLNESKRWRFLAARPFSAGFFLGCMMAALIYEYEGLPAVVKLANTIVGGISFARLSGGLIEASWKRQFVYSLMTIFIVTRLMDVLSFPLPFFRLYTFLTALAGLLFCLRWSGKSIRKKDSGFYTWSLRFGSLLFAVIMIAELLGKKALSLHLFVSSIRSLAIALVFMLFLHMIHGGLEWLFRTSTLRLSAVLRSHDTDAIIRRVSRFIDVAILGLVLLPSILMMWGVYDSLEEATKGLLALGFNLGSQRISVSLLIASAGVLYGSFLASWIIEKLLMNEVFVKHTVERGVRVSIGRLVHYVLIFVGFLLALSILGFEVTERPVRVGDTIEIDGKWAEIKKIGLRATNVRTLDYADVIIPNADLVANQVTNWTLSNRRVRLTVPVGVAYGSDVPLVMEKLTECAKENAMVDKTHAPQVLFLSFGESSLDFELRVWVVDADYRLKAKSELHQEIDRRFREAKIEIAFPQRDLHLRSVDEPVILGSSETTG